MPRAATSRACGQDIAPMLGCTLRYDAKHGRANPGDRRDDSGRDPGADNGWRFSDSRHSRRPGLAVRPVRHPPGWGRAVAGLGRGPYPGAGRAYLVTTDHCADWPAAGLAAAV
jgi:hypothetical protein